MIWFCDLEAYGLNYYNKFKRVDAYFINGIEFYSSNKIEKLSIKEFYEESFKLMDPGDIHYHFYHNLGTYDGHFLISTFKEHNIKIKDYLIAGNKNIYEIKIYKRTNGVNKVIIIRDFYKLFPHKLKELGDSINFNKGDFDVTVVDKDLRIFKDMDDLKQSYNGELYNYADKDIMIMYNFAHSIKKISPIEEMKLTISSTSFNEMLESNSWTAYKYYVDKNQKMKKTRYNSPLRFKLHDYTSKDKEERKYEELDVYNDLFAGVRGGFTFVNKNHQLVLTNGWSYDFKSMYPSIYRNHPLPWQAIITDPKFKWLCSWNYYKVRIKHLKLKESIPIGWITLKSTKPNSDNRPEFLKNVTIYLTSTELPYINKFYDGEYTATWLYGTRTKTGLFKNYVDKWFTIKENAKKVGNEVLGLNAKLRVNTPFGKTIENVYKEGVYIANAEDIKVGFIFNEVKKNKKVVDYYKIIKVEKKEMITWVTYENKFGDVFPRVQVLNTDDSFRYIKTPETLKNFKLTYLPFGMEITSIGRTMLYDIILEYKNDVLYGDTDSIKFKTKPNIINGWLYDKEGKKKLFKVEKQGHEKDKLGIFEFEYYFENAIIRRRKHYRLDKYTKDFKQWKKPLIKGGGFNVSKINESNTITKEIYLQEEFEVEDGKLFRKLVKGGVILYEGLYKFTNPLNGEVDEYLDVDDFDNKYLNEQQQNEF